MNRRILLCAVAGMALAVSAACSGGGGGGGPGCPEWGCGTNTAWAGAKIWFHELDASGQAANSAGLKVVGLSVSNAPAQLDVQGDVLIAKQNGQPVNYSEAMLELKRVENNVDKEHYFLRIKPMNATSFWVDPAGVQVPTYKIDYSVNTNSGPWDSLCKGTSEVNSMSSKALIFRGDRYNASAKTVSNTGANDTWFNVACAGGAPAKMHLLRHTFAGNADNAHATAEGDRQAVLKMLTGDFCGNGVPHTVDGVPLLFSYDQDWQPIYRQKVPSGIQIEAIWSSKGAICLNTPRNGQNRATIVAECKTASGGAELQPCPVDISWAEPLAMGSKPWKHKGYAVSATTPNATITYP
jgi:hypothetical protein